jgi:hypothetical protein
MPYVLPKTNLFPPPTEQNDSLQTTTRRVRLSSCTPLAILPNPPSNNISPAHSHLPPHRPPHPPIPPLRRTLPHIPRKRQPRSIHMQLRAEPLLSNQHDRSDDTSTPLTKRSANNPPPSLTLPQPKSNTPSLTSSSPAGPTHPAPP